MREPHLIVVGPGRVGLSAAADASAAGAFSSVSVVGRRPERPDFLSHQPAVAYLEAHEVVARAPTVLIVAVPAGRIAAVAEEWAAREDAGSISTALHTSGVDRADVLSPLRDRGAVLASWHPLLAMARPEVGAFNGATIGIEGDAAAIDVAAGLARSVGARPLRLRSDRKPLYHAAAVFGSNHLVASLAIAERLLSTSAEEEAGFDDLLPLARSALANLAESGLPGGATGPLARGDLRTIREHLSTLDPQTRAVYRALARELLDRVGERLDGTSRTALGRELSAPATEP